MDATSMALCHTKVEEIRRRISEGELTAQQIHDILISEIENELSRPTKEVNMAYVKICEELLSSLSADDESLVDQYYIRNHRSIRKVLGKSHFSQRRLPKFKLVTAFCLAAAMLFAVVLIPNGKIEITPSADDEQYIIQGHSIQSTNSIANAGPSLDHLGSYDTTDWQEVVRLMGGTPQIPQWLPEGWSVTRYSIDLMDSFSALEIKYENNERSEEWLSYTLFVYFSIDDMYNAVEKDRNGTEILLNNGKKVYMFGNLGTQDIMWIEGQNEFNLSGNIENRYMLQMAESIKFWRFQGQTVQQIHRKEQKMKKICLIIVAILMLSIQVLPVSADNRFEPFADLVVKSGSAYLNSSGKGIFKLTTKQDAAEIKVTSCSLYKKDGRNSSFVKSLDTPTNVAKNRSLYSATVDYSSHLTSGQTYYIVATFNIDGYEKVYTSPTVTIK